MSATKYTAGTEIAYFDPATKQITTDKIWRVRNGYYHMPSDHYLHDENIVGSIVDGKKIENELFLEGRLKTIDILQQEVESARNWINGFVKMISE